MKSREWTLKSIKREIVVIDGDYLQTRDQVTVREVNPAYDAAVEGMRTALIEIRKLSLGTKADLCDEALEAYDKIVSQGAE